MVASDLPAAPVEDLGVPVLLARPVIAGEAGPHPQRDDFPDLEAYEQAFRLWRAIVRDGRPTNDELAASLAVALALVDRHSRVARGHLSWYPV